ncbi:MAG: shikimate kinase [Muribaculaceae bacterium]|nr:shikimate kinase [Muribaculaceae bacterium]
MAAVFLLGLPGCGKSTLGHALERLGYSFADTDEAVERRCGCTVAELIGREGMAHFRSMEAEELRRLIAEGIRIIACGGGTPCHGDNMELMNRSGITVRLECERSRHIRRLAEAGGSRPMFAGMERSPEAIGMKVDELQALREPFYTQATVVFDSSRLESEEEINETAAKFISRILDTPASKV